jgi:hypothetical protein
MKTIAFKPLISVEIIYSFDNKEQEMWSFNYFLEDVLMSEDKLVKDLITRPYVDVLETLNDLYKVSMCFSCEVEDFVKLPGFKDIFSKNGKYYFDPKQRDEVENKIIEGTSIASETKPFLMAVPN